MVHDLIHTYWGLPKNPGSQCLDMFFIYIYILYVRVAMNQLDGFYRIFLPWNSLNFIKTSPLTEESCFNQNMMQKLPDVCPLKYPSIYPLEKMIVFYQSIG